MGSRALLLNKPKMAYSRDLADMDCLGLAWITGMDYTRLLMVADLSYFYILFSYGQMD